MKPPPREATEVDLAMLGVRKRIQAAAARYDAERTPEAARELLRLVDGGCLVVDRCEACKRRRRGWVGTLTGIGLSQPKKAIDKPIRTYQEAVVFLCEDCLAEHFGEPSEAAA